MTACCVAFRLILLAARFGGCLQSTIKIINCKLCFMEVRLDIFTGCVTANMILINETNIWSNTMLDHFWILQILALLARYHRKKVPSQKDEDFASLPDEVSVTSYIFVSFQIPSLLSELLISGT